MDVPRKKRSRRRKRSTYGRWLNYVKRQKYPLEDPIPGIEENPVYDNKGNLLYYTKKIGEEYYHISVSKRKSMRHDDPSFKKPTSYEEHEDWFDSYTPEQTVVNIVPRSSWGAQDVEDLEELHIPVTKVVIFYTNTEACFTRQECVNAMKKLQNHFIAERNVPDIPYNFLIGTDGDVYEGRGWTTKPTKVHKLYRYRTHKELQNTIDVAYVGPFKGYGEDPLKTMHYWPKDSFVVPMQRSLEALLKYGLKNNYLRGDFTAHQLYY